MRKKLLSSSKRSLILTVLIAVLFSIFPVGNGLNFVQDACAAPGVEEGSLLRGNRYGIDEGMTRRVADSYTISQLPFEEAWSVDLGGEVEGQPIVIDSTQEIIVQAGKHLLKLNYDQASKAKPPVVSFYKNITSHEWATGSTPTYAITKYGPRLYVATRDHMLWAFDPITLTPFWSVVVSAGGKDHLRYRITTSPLVTEINGKTIISIGTAFGDQTGKTKEYYADNGFFVIEDTGNKPKLHLPPERMGGEVSGSHIFFDGKILGTENTLNAKSAILMFDPKTSKISANNRFEFDAGVAASLSYAEDKDKFLYGVDRNGTIYKVDAQLKPVWQNNKDENGKVLKNSLSFSTPAIGDEYVYKSFRHYKNIQSGGPGAIMVHNKSDGRVVKVIELSSPVKSHPLYWKPKEDEPGYLIVYESNGKVQFFKEGTWEPVAWFKDSNGQMKKSISIADTEGQYSSPDIMFHDNLLIIVDGKGVMRAYKAQRPHDFNIETLEILDGKIEDLKVGDPVRLRASFASTGDVTFDNVTVRLSQIDEEGKWITVNKSLQMPRRSKGNVVEFTTTVQNQFPYFSVIINPDRDNPPNEVTYSNNQRSILIPIDMRLDEIKLDKTFISKENKKVKATVTTFVENYQGLAPNKKIKTFIRFTIDQLKIEKPVELVLGQKQKFDFELDLTSIDLKNRNAIVINAGVNPDFAISENHPQMTPEQIKANNFTRSSADAVKPPVLIVLGEFDLVADSISAKSNATFGDKVTITGTVKNQSTKAADNVLVSFYADAQKVYETRTSFQQGQSKQVSFVWDANKLGPTNLRIVVDPNEETEDSNRTNNVKDRVISVTAKSNVTVTCSTSKPEGNWNVTYWIITGYPTRTGSYEWTDEFGEKHEETYSYTDYSSPIWSPRTVQYNEKLEQNVTVNTKQGIPTDPKNPKTEDRESRGSWEIIPWAQKNGLNPNEVTRAGYGFEISVNTTYWTDYETKVPRGLENTASAYGGSYEGPTEVGVEIFDTSGNLVHRTALERTSGNGLNATWQLPEQQHTLSTGEKIRDRKYYTSIDAKDGDYTVRIIAKYAGATGLSICTTKKVRIFGSMYDDTQQNRD